MHTASSVKYSKICQNFSKSVLYSTVPSSWKSSDMSCLCLGFPHVAMSQKETTTSDREEELLRLNTTPDSAHCAAERESICDYSLAHCAACNTQLL